jgi:hypothetical protein
MTSSLYNDMPGELREKIHLCEVLNQILKNNGFVDIAAVLVDLANLKNQINVLLSDVLGLEHEIDGVHNYDDTDLNTKLNSLNTKLETFREAVNSDVNGLISRITGINKTTSKISLQNLLNIEVSTMNASNHGTRIILLPQQITLQNVSESPIPEANPIFYGQISIGGGLTTDGVTIDSDNPITLNSRTGSHHLTVKSDKVEVTDINVLKVSYVGDGVTLKDFTNTHVAHIPWDMD